MQVLPAFHSQGLLPGTVRVEGILAKPVISIVDDDEFVRDGVRDLVRSLGYSAHAYASAEECLMSNDFWDSSCLIVDIQMPGMSGTDLQAKLIASGNVIPIIFMTAFPDQKMCRRLLDAGASGYLQKPFDDKSFVQCLEKALSPAT
jgi:FixJ family two-component response regulator